MDYYWTNIFSKIISQTLDRAFSKRWRVFWKSLDVFAKTPWRIHECALARWRISLDAFACSSRRVKWCSFSPLYMKVCVSTLHPIHHRAIVVYISVLSYRITYTSATEDQTFENQHVPVADALKPVCHICHGAVALHHFPLQIICHHSPLIHRMICFRCSVAVIDANVLL